MLQISGAKWNGQRARRSRGARQIPTDKDTYLALSDGHWAGPPRNQGQDSEPRDQVTTPECLGRWELLTQ